MKAVISGDIIESTNLPLAARKQITPAIKKALQSLRKKTKVKAGIERGDFIQAEMDPAEGMHAVILLKAVINQIEVNADASLQSNAEVDIRISMGLGNISLDRSKPGESDGTAYQLSGRGLDQLKATKQKLMFQCENEDTNQELNTMARAMEFITDRWTKGSAQVVELFLEGLKEVEIAGRLGISQPAVNQRKKAAGWDVLQAFLERYDSIIKKIENT